MQIMPVAIGIGPKAAISSRFLKWSIFSDRVAFLLLLLFCFLCVCWSRKLIEFLLNLILNKKDWANGKHYSTKLIKKSVLASPSEICSKHQRNWKQKSRSWRDQHRKVLNFLHLISFFVLTLYNLLHIKCKLLVIC